MAPLEDPLPRPDLPDPWQGIEDGYQRLAADEAKSAAYRADAATWTAADLDELAATAAEEYPEYNS